MIKRENLKLLGLTCLIGFILIMIIPFCNISYTDYTTYPFEEINMSVSFIVGGDMNIFSLGFGGPFFLTILATIVGFITSIYFIINVKKRVYTLKVMMIIVITCCIIISIDSFFISTKFLYYRDYSIMSTVNWNVAIGISISFVSAFLILEKIWNIEEC